MKQWQKDEIVFCWSPGTETFFKGMVYDITPSSLKIAAFSNGKVYNFNLDGSAIENGGRTNQRVFSVRELSQVQKQEY
jgi:hypothetical protein